MTTIFTVVCLVTPFISFMESFTASPIQQIANMHTTFNLATSLLLLPFGTLLAKAATKILPEKEEELEEIQQLRYIVPFERNYHVGHSAVILTQIEQEVSRMFEKAKQNLTAAYDALLKKDISKLEEINAREEYIDYLNTEISKYIVGLMSTEIIKHETIINQMQKEYLEGQILRAKNGTCKAESGILFSELLTDFERVGDYAKNIAELHMQMS